MIHQGSAQLLGVGLQKKQPSGVTFFTCMCILTNGGSSAYVRCPSDLLVPDSALVTSRAHNGNDHLHIHPYRTLHLHGSYWRSCHPGCNSKNNHFLTPEKKRLGGGLVFFAL